MTKIEKTLRELSDLWDFNMKLEKRKGKAAPKGMESFDALIKSARKQAKEAGIKPSDIQKAVRKVRRENKG